jgi:hypothetical protein
MKNVYKWFKDQLSSISDRYWNVKSFIINAWRFRHELVEFGPYDYSCNLHLFARSLEITADFLESDKAMTCSAAEHAEEIREFLDLLTHCQSPYDLAEARLGHAPDLCLIFDDWDQAAKAHEDSKSDVPWIEMPCRERSDEDVAYHEECDRIEKEMWEQAWVKFSEQAQCWWD